MNLELGILGPGIAFWRAKEHGWDRWFWGLLRVKVEDWFHWSFGIRVLDFDMAPGMHFDHYHTALILIGPFEVALLYIEDRKN